MADPNCPQPQAIVSPGLLLTPLTTYPISVAAKATPTVGAAKFFLAPLNLRLLEAVGSTLVTRGSLIVYWRNPPVVVSKATTNTPSLQLRPLMLGLVGSTTAVTAAVLNPANLVTKGFIPQAVTSNSVTSATTLLVPRELGVGLTSTGKATSNPPALNLIIKFTGVPTLNTALAQSSAPQLITARLNPSPINLIGNVTTNAVFRVTYNISGPTVATSLVTTAPVLVTKEFIPRAVSSLGVTAASILGLKFEFTSIPVCALKATSTVPALLNIRSLGTTSTIVTKADLKLVSLVLRPLSLGSTTVATLLAQATSPALVTKELVANTINAKSLVPVVNSAKTDPAATFIILMGLKVPLNAITALLETLPPDMVVLHPVVVPLFTNPWYPLTATVALTANSNLGIKFNATATTVESKLTSLSARLQVGLVPTSLTVVGTVAAASLGLKFVMADTANPIFSVGALAVAPVTLGVKFELGLNLGADVTLRSNTFAPLLPLAVLNLGLPPVVAPNLIVPPSPYFDVGRLVVIDLSVPAVPSVTALCRSASAFMFSGLQDVTYPIKLQEQIRYPVPTASSISAPSIADAPVYYSHNVFGATVVAVNPGSGGTAQLSARLHSALGLINGDYYPDYTVYSPSVVLLFRASNLNTSSVVKSTSGYKAIGADVTRFTTNYESSSASPATDFPPANNTFVSRMSATGTYDLVTGSTIADSRTLSTSSPNKRLMIASTLVRHNYNQALATTVPISVATDFNYPKLNTTRPTRARIESSVSHTNEVGLSPIYSSNHLAVIDDAEYAARASSNAEFGFNAAIVGRQATTITQHVHSSDAMFSFIPIKSGVKHTFSTNYAPLAGNYTVASAAFVVGTGNFAVKLIDGNSVILAPSSLSGRLKLRIRIASYRATVGRNVFIEIPVLGANTADDAFIIDSSYRWFAQQVAATPAGQFSTNATVTVLQDTKYFAWNQSTANLVITRPNVMIDSLPQGERGGDDQGESRQALLSTAGDRNVLIGEFSLTAIRPSTLVAADVQVSTSANSSIQTYGDTSSTPSARQVAAFDPDYLQIIIDQNGDLKGQVADNIAGQPTTSADVTRMLPTAVKNYTTSGGKYAKVVVGQNAVGLLTTPTSGTVARRLYVWGNNLYGHLVPPDDIYDLFAQSGYIANVKEFDIGPSYMCVVLDDGTMRCWGNLAATTHKNTPKSPWVTVVNDLNANITGAVGEKFSVINYKGTLKQYGSISQNIPALNGWAVPSPTAHSQVACGAAHAIALKADGSIACWGDNSYTQCTIPGAAEGTNIVAVAAGHNHSVALLSTGTVVCWGDNAAGQCTVPASLLAKQITAGGNFTGCLRTAASTDVTATDNAYLDIEDTFRGWGSNSHYQLAVPLCEGKSYDPSYPHYRMKFHRVVAGYDHVAGIRKVEPDLARLVHPEVCHLANYQAIQVPLKTAAGVLIFDNIRNIATQQLNWIVDAEDPLKKYTAPVTPVGGGPSYRFAHYNNTGLAEMDYTIQKLVGGVWADLAFKLTVNDANGAYSYEDDLFTYVGRIVPCWNGSGAGLPSWTAGVDPVIAAYLSPEQYYLSASTAGAGEYVEVNTSDADAYGNSATNEYVVCWGNPMAYDTASSMLEYTTNYGVDPSNNSETALANQITINKATPSYAKVRLNKYLRESYPHVNTVSYVGRKGYTNALTLELTNLSTTAPFCAPLTPLNPELYVGPSSAIPIPAGQVFGAHAVWMVSIATGTNVDPEYHLINCALPVSATYNADGRDIHVFYSNAASTEDSTSNKVWAARGCVKARKLPILGVVSMAGFWDATRKFQILADNHDSIIGYGWGTSPTGFWYILNNLVAGTSNVLNTNIPQRHYNLTGVVVGDLTGNNPVIHFPYEAADFKIPSASVLAHANLIAKPYYIVRHQTNQRLAVVNAKSLQCGKHQTHVPTITPGTLLQTWRPWGVKPGGTSGTTEASGILNPSTNSYLAAVGGYRSAHLLDINRNMSVFLVGAGSVNHLIAKPAGDNRYGQLNSSDYLEAYSNVPPMAYPPLSVDQPPQLTSSWFMNVGQLNVPTVAAGQVFTKVACGQYHTLALDSRSKIYAWGSNARIEPAYSNLALWWPPIPTHIPAPPDTPSPNGILSYFAQVDTLHPTNWPDNYIDLPNGVAAALTLTGSVNLPYPTTPEPAVVDEAKATFEVLSGSSYFSSAKNDWFVNQASTHKSGAFKLEIVPTTTVGEYCFQVGTDLATTKYTSNPIPAYVAGNRLISWEINSDANGSDLGTQATTIKARVNGTDVTWPGELVDSPVFSNINPASALGLFGAGFDSFKLLPLRVVADATVTGAIAGKNFAALIVTPDPLKIPATGLSALRLCASSGLPNYPSSDPEFLAISVGATVGATSTKSDVCLLLVPRAYEVIGASPHTSGSPYFSDAADQAIVKYVPSSTAYKILVPNAPALLDPMTYSSNDWPKVVFPGEELYGNSYSYAPSAVGLFRSPDVVHTADQFTFTLIPAVVNEPSSTSFYPDYVSMAPTSSEIYGNYIAYNNNPTSGNYRKIIPQAYGPLSAPATYTGPVAAAPYTSFAVAAGTNQLTSWGQDIDHSRTHGQISSFEIHDFPMPTELTALACNSYDGGVFRGVGLSATGTVHMWGTGTGYYQNYPSADGGVVGANKVYREYALNGTKTLLTGYTKIASVGTDANFEAYIGIDQSGQLDYFRVQVVAVPDNGENQLYKYLKYVKLTAPADFPAGYDSAQWTDYLIPAAIRDTAFTDIQTYSNSSAGGHALALSSAGKVYCWGWDPSGQNQVSAFNSRRHAGVDNTNEDSAPTIAFPSPYTIIQASASLVTAIAVGNAHSAALFANGRVLIWGYLSEYTSASGYQPYAISDNPYKTASVVPKKLGSCKNTFAVITNANAVVAWPATGDTYGTTLTSGITVGAFNTSIISCSPVANHFIIRDNNGAIKCWGAGKRGDIGASNTGQSEVPVDMNASGTWDTYQPTKRFAAIVNPVVGRSTTQSNKLVLVGATGFAPLPPLAIYATSDDFPVTSTEVAGKLNVVGIAAGTNIMFAIVGANYNSTFGYLVQWGTATVNSTLPTGDTYTKLASSHAQLGGAWSHAAALTSANAVVMWGVDPYWATTPLTNTYQAIACTNNAVAAIQTGTLLIEVRTLDPVLALPVEYTAVKFSSVVGGETHFVATVAEAYNASTANGLLTLAVNDIVAWGHNDLGQCNVPGYSLLTPTISNGPSSDFIAAGSTFTAFRRKATGYATSIGTALGFTRGGLSSTEYLEGYMHHYSGGYCDQLLPTTHPYYLNPPMQSYARKSINANTGHAPVFGWTTGATEVPADFSSTSPSPRKASLICAGRFKQYNRDSSGDMDYVWGAGYSVFVEAAEPNGIFVFGGRQRKTGCNLPFVNAAELALYQTPTIANDLVVASLNSHMGYLYALDSHGAVLPWGYTEGANDYFAVSNDSDSLVKQNLNVPRTVINDSAVGYLNANSIAASYVTGVPDISAAWALQVSLIRYLNDGQESLLRRFAITGDTSIISVNTAQPVHFAETFMALDTWPAVSTALDSYYALKVTTAGGGVQYKVNSASLFAMNLDSKNSVGAKILVQAGASPIMGDYAIATAENYLPSRNLDNNEPVFISAAVENNAGFDLTYVNDPTYPTYLRNRFGSTARIENIVTANSKLTLGGRVSYPIVWLPDANPAVKAWWRASSATITGANVTAWPSSAAINRTLLPTAGGNPATLTNPFTTNTTAVAFTGNGATNATRFTSENPNAAIGQFTYFIVKKNTLEPAGTLIHNTIVATSRSSTATRSQGIGEALGFPAIVYATGDVTRYHLAATAVWPSNTNGPHIVGAYFGATTDYGLRVDGTQVALAANSVQVYPSNVINGPSSNVNGYHLNDNILSSTGPTEAMNVRVRLQQVAEVIVFESRLSEYQIQLVEGYLAWKYSLQASLPNTHPYSSLAPISASGPPNVEELAALWHPALSGDPANYLDIGLAATGAAETWTALYSAGAQYSSPKFTATRGTQENHAPLIVEFELNQQNTIGFIANVVNCVAAVNRPDILVDPNLIPPPPKVITQLTCSAGVNTFNVVTYKLMGSGTVTTKAVISSSSLLLTPLSLGLSTAQIKLGFLGGLDCDGPYGCTGTSTNPPDLIVIKGSLEAPTTAMRAISSIPDLGIKWEIRYATVQTVNNTTGSNLVGPFSLIPASPATQLALNVPAVTLTGLYSNPMSVGISIRVRCKATVEICDASGFIINTYKTKIPAPKVVTPGKPGKVS